MDKMWVLKNYQYKRNNTKQTENLFHFSGYSTIIALFFLSIFRNYLFYSL